MERQRWKQIREMFDAAADLPRDGRRAFLQDACRDDESLLDEVLAMLEEDSRGGFLLDGNVSQLASQVLRGPFAPPFHEFGPYRIKHVLGEGGMGVVYLAERHDLGNLVAIKVLRDGWLSPARRNRFAMEQKTLAKLNHPSIARLYDSHTLADGTPWFVMEYVEGAPLNEYCATHRCSVEQRIKLFRAVCEAVQYAHEHGVIHRDLKPSNVLVKQDGSVRLLDFGIAKQVEPGAAPVDQTRTGLRLMTPAYAAPEQIRGEPAGVPTDVYSLGVILYELLAGRLPFDVTGKTPQEAAATIATEEPRNPSAVAQKRGSSRNELDIVCLAAMHRDPCRRYPSAAALVRDLDHYLRHEPLEARADSLGYTLTKFVRRNRQTISAAAIASAVILLAVTLAGMLRTSAPPAKIRARTVAVLPFRKAVNEPSLDYLSFAIPDEIARVLGYARSLSVRPFETSRRYVDSRTNAQQAGREMRVGTIVTGEYAKGVDQIQIVLEAIDVESNRYFWRETFRVPIQNGIELQAQIAAKTRESLGPLLGASEFIQSAQPKNEAAYDLFLRAAGLYSDPADVKAAIDIFQKSLALDPTYAPAWAGLAVRYRLEGWYSGGGASSLDRAEAAAERALSLDPNNLDAARGLIVSRTGRGEVVKAYQEASDFLKRRPDSEQAHFALSYVFRSAGLLNDAARECDAAFLIEPLNAGNRSCGILFMLRGNYQRAMDFINLDAGSEWARTLTLETLLRQGKVSDAQAAGPKSVPQWAAFNVLFASLEHQSAQTVATLARTAKAEGDAESNYLAAAHLAYAGQSGPALKMLDRAIQGGYCSYPAIDSDPLLANARNNPEFAQIRASAVACQNRFLTQTGR